MVMLEPHASVAAAAPVAAGSLDWPHSTVAFGGQLNTGGFVSTTGIFESQLPAQPPSVVVARWTANSPPQDPLAKTCIDEPFAAPTIEAEPVTVHA